MRFGKKAMIVAPLVLAAVLGGGAASADMNSYVTGGHAWRSPVGTVNIKDTLGNDEAVYVQYRRTGDTSDRRLNNNSGLGATASSSGTTVTGLKACQDRSLLPDVCDSWKTS